MTLTAPDETVAESTARRPGRPRRADIERRALDAVVALVDEDLPVTVNAVVERSGVSRAAVYRRWDTLAKLVAAALDRGRAPIEIPADVPLREALIFAAPQTGRDPLNGYPESRLRQRLRLGLADRQLQREYWSAHVTRRRRPVAAALQRAQDVGELRTDVDIDALQDLLAGVYYYQVVVRGESLTDPETVARCNAAVAVVWRGLLADDLPASA